jgi:4-amino-4-deoxy-L-arabinose transferase-like glycosyltransferase
MRNYRTTGFFIIAMIFIWMVLEPLMHDGMFLDGLQYAAVARNLADGEGSFWDQHYTETLFNHFHQQPPLYTGIQSLFFKVIGDSIYTERIFCLLMGIIMIFLLAIAWKKFMEDPEEKRMYWLPVLTWLFIPTVSWGLKSNVTENLMVIFDFLCVLFLVNALEGKKRAINLFLSIIFLFAASLTKGIQGLFPIAMPIIYWITIRRISLGRTIVITIVAAVSIAFIYFFLFQNSVVRESYIQYYNQRLRGFPATPEGDQEYHFYLLSRIFIELIVPFLFCLIVLLIAVKRKLSFSIKPQKKKLSMFFLLVALSASLPLLIVYEQRGFYLITATPYFSLSLALIISSPLSMLIESSMKKNYRVSLAINVALIIGIVVGMIMTSQNAGKIKRDHALLHDVYLIRESFEIAPNVVSVSSTDITDWAMQGYFERYDKISLSTNCDSCNYFFQKKSSAASDISGYKKLGLNTELLDVFKKK